MSGEFDEHSPPPDDGPPLLSDARRDELVAAFALEVHAHAGEVDPENEQDWYSLTLGWALGKGVSPAGAHEIALYIRYRTDLG